MTDAAAGFDAPLALTAHHDLNDWSGNGVHHELEESGKLEAVAGHRAVLEVADHRGEQVIVAGVEVVEDRLRHLAGLLEAIEKSGQWPSFWWSSWV